MGTFIVLALEVFMTSCIANDHPIVEASFKKSYLSNPWSFPNAKYETSCGMDMPLFVVKATYQAIQEKTGRSKSQPSHLEECNMYLSSIWVVSLSTYSNPLDITLLFDENIMKDMNPIEKPWDINHQ